MSITRRRRRCGLRFETLDEAQAYLDRWEAHWADTRIPGTHCTAPMQLVSNVARLTRELVVVESEMLVDPKDAEHAWFIEDEYYGDTQTGSTGQRAWQKRSLPAVLTGDKTLE